MRTLIVDDDPVFLAVADGVLRMLGISEIETHTDVASALKAMNLGERSFDLILLDLNIPDLDGISALRSLSEANFQGSIVLVTGENESVLSSVRQIAARLRIKICGAIRKPIKPELLRSAIEQARSDAHSPSGIHVASPPSPTDKLDPLIYYQVQVDTLENSIAGAEGLLRLKSQKGQIFGPEAVFREDMSLDDRLRLTIDLFSQLCADLKHLQKRGFQQRLAVNVDASVLEVPNFQSAIMSVVGACGVTCGQITIELTEHQLPRHPTQLLETIARLRMQGFGVSLDDFGTGGSNFELIRDGAFSEVKIDRSIAGSVLKNQASCDFVKYAIALAQKLGLRLVAEGIEDKSVADWLKGVGITKMQGFLFGKAEPFDCLLARLHQRQAVELTAS